MSLRLRGILLVICQGYCFKYNVSSCRLLGMGPPPLIVSSGRNLLMHDATSLTVWRGMQQFCACCHFFHFGEARIHIFHLIQVMEVCNSFSAYSCFAQLDQHILSLTISPRLAFPPWSPCILFSSQLCKLSGLKCFDLVLLTTPPPPHLGGHMGGAHSKRLLSLHQNTHPQVVTIFGRSSLG